MDKKEIRSSNILFLLKCLLFSYILTGGFLLLLALFLYKFQLSEKIVSIAIIVIYVMTGKRMGSRKFLWGLAVGLAYFAVMALISLAVNHEFKDLGTHFFTTLSICAAGGMLGGMLS
jgi:putative membrane protein (TIGR04086 family)